mgnify:CR=1 FL=1
MAIIVEIKSKNCCRQKVLTEQEEGFLAGLGNFFTGMISGKGNSFSKAIATEIQTTVVKGILNQIFDIDANPEIKDTILYQSFSRAVGSIDLKDMLKLFTDERSSLCNTLAENLVQGVASVVANDISEELEYFFNQRADKLEGILAKLAPALQGMSGLAKSVGTLLQNQALEQMKAEGSLNEISEAICSIDFLSLVKDIPGVETAIGLFSE